MEIEVISRKERQRVSDRLRENLELQKVTVAKDDTGYNMN